MLRDDEAVAWAEAAVRAEHRGDVGAALADRAPVGEVAAGDAPAGDAQAGPEPWPRVSDELRRLVAVELALLRPGQRLQPTALVHEAWVKLAGGTDPGWNSRRHFFGAAAQAMREIIVDHVHRKAARPPGAGQAHAALQPDFALAGGGLPEASVLAIDAALTALEIDHPRKAQIVVMRYFGGFAVPEIAAMLGLTTRTVEREWRFARGFLRVALSRAPA